MALQQVCPLFLLIVMLSAIARLTFVTFLLQIALRKEIEKQRREEDESNLQINKWLEEGAKLASIASSIDWEEGSAESTADAKTVAEVVHAICQRTR